MSKANPVGWFEIYVQDMARAKVFYETVLATELSKMVEDAEMTMYGFPMEMGADGAAGALVHMPGMPSGGNSTLIYFKSEDCAVESARVAANGGQVFKEKFSIGEYGFIALATDTEGNMFGIWSMK